MVDGDRWKLFHSVDMAEIIATVEYLQSSTFIRRLSVDGSVRPVIP